MTFSFVDLKLKQNPRYFRHPFDPTPPAPPSTDDRPYLRRRRSGPAFPRRPPFPFSRFPKLKTKLEMCHRHLTFKKSSACGHLILTEERQVDCRDPECYNSSAHPLDCAARSGRTSCWCRRYYTQPERVVKPGQLPNKCPTCASRSSW